MKDPHSVYKFFRYLLFKKAFLWGSGCDSVGRTEICGSIPNIDKFYLLSTELKI